MYTYYRTASYGTAAKNIIYGDVYDCDKKDIVLVKNYSLEFMRIQNIPNNESSDNDILKSTFEQQTFGIINDAKILPCVFKEDNEEEEQINDIIITDTTPIKNNVDDSSNDSDDSIESKKPIQYTQHTRIGHSPIQANSMIVLISEYNQLMFCTVVGQQKNLKSTGRFESITKISVGDPGLEYDKVNKKLAIDPQSRAIAISAFVDRVDVMLLNDKMSRSFFSPVVGLVSIREIGIIWNVEFLYTEPSSKDRILLAMVVYNDDDKICRIALYNINASVPNKPEAKLIGRLPLDKNTPLPLLLIPLRCHPEFLMLITNQTICVLNADDIVSGNVLYSVDSILEDAFDGEIEEEQICTSYSFSADPKVPIVYLGTASGHIIKVDISNVILMSYTIIYRGNPIGQDMCSLGNILIQDENKRSVEAEALFFIGESADSEILAINTENDQDCFVLQTFLNRASIIDSQLLQRPGLPDSIVTCSGQDKHGSLQYLSYNIDTSVMFVSEDDWKGITKLWYIPESSNCFHLVASSFYDTRMVHLGKAETGSKLSLETNVQTIFSCTINTKWSTQIFVQIIQDRILIFDFTSNVILLRHNVKLGYKILFATMWEDQQKNLFLLCLSNGELYDIQVYELINRFDTQELKMHLDELKLCSEISLNSSPTCLGNLPNTMIPKQAIYIGTYDSSVLIYHFNYQSNTLELINEISCNDVPHSISAGKRHLLIGTRYGNILTIPETALRNSYTPISRTSIAHNQYHMGSHPVQLFTNQDGTIFALCHSIWHIRENDNDDQFIFEPIDLCGATNITAAISLKHDSMMQQPGHYRLALVANGKLYLLNVKGGAHVLTKKLQLNITPRRILLHDQAVTYVASVSKIRGKYFSELDLIDKSAKPICNLRFGQGEHIHCLSKWEVVNKGKTYHYICVGVENRIENRARYEHDPSKTYGSLYLYRLKANHHGTIKHSTVPYTLRLAWHIKHISGGGVRAICPHPSGLLFSSGSTLHLHQLDLDKGELVEITHKLLRFPITSIHVAGDRICITSQIDSVSFYKYDQTSKQLEFLNSDSISRSVHRSLLIDDHTVVGVSLSGGMFALKESSKASFEEESLQTLFCFHYPDMIIRPFCTKYRIQLSTEYQTGLLADHILQWKKGSAPPTQLPPSIKNNRYNNNNNTSTNSDHHIGQSDPIVGCTISGGMIVNYRCTQSLFKLLNELQYRLLDYTPTKPLLGSKIKYLKWYLNLSGPPLSTIHGDYIQLHLRLTTEQQYEVLGYIKNDANDNNMELVLSMLDICLEFYRDTISRRYQETMSDLSVTTHNSCLSPNKEVFNLWPSYPSKENKLEIVNWINTLIVHVLTIMELYYF